MEKTVTTYEQKYAAAEGLWNYLEAEVSRTAKISAIMNFAERVYDEAREHEREDIRARI